MRRLTAVTLAASLLAANAVSALAQAPSPSPLDQTTSSPAPTPSASPRLSPSPRPSPLPSPSPSPSEGGTVQQVRSGDLSLELEIPQTWVVEDPASHPFDLAVRNPARVEECWLVIDAASFYAGQTLIEKAAVYAAELQRIYELDEAPTWVSRTLPSGGAVRLDSSSQWLDSFTYLWLQDDVLPALTCQGLDPGDQWLSIAESVEFTRVADPTRPPALPTPTPTLVAPTPRAEPAAVVEQTHEPLAIRVTERGSRPRRLLRYDWSEGQKEVLGIDIRMNSERSVGIDSTGRIEIPTLRMTVEIEVLEAFANGDYLVEQTLTELGVPVGEEGDLAMAREMEAALASMMGLRIRTRVNDRGVILQSETHYPQVREPAAQDALDIGLDAMTAFIQPLPEQRVGLDAVWRIAQDVESDLGFEATRSTRTKLREMADGEIRLLSKVRQMAPRQPVEVGADAGFRVTLDAHDLTSETTALVELRRLTPEVHATTTSRTRFTAKQGQQVETAIIDLAYDLRLQPAEPGGSSRPGQGTRRRSVPRSGGATRLCRSSCLPR